MINSTKNETSPKLPIKTMTRSTWMTLVWLALVTGNTKLVAEPGPVASTEATAEHHSEELSRETAKIKMIFEKDGKQEASFTAFGSMSSDSKQLYCTGVVAVLDTELWRVDLTADMQGNQFSDVTVEIEDLKLFRRNNEGETVPLKVFSTQIQSKGLGNYLFGEVRGLTVRVEISKAE